jgi:hypothetical protein
MAIENPATIAAVISATATVANGILSATIAFIAVRISQNSQDTREKQNYTRKVRDLKRERLHETYYKVLDIALRGATIIERDPISRAGSVDEEELNHLVQGFQATREEMKSAQTTVLMYTEPGSATATAFAAIVALLVEYIVYMDTYIEQLERGETTPESITQITDLQKKMSIAKRTLTEAIRKELEKYDDPF